MRFTDPTEEMLKGWRDWILTRPKCIQEAAKGLDPWTLYRLPNPNKDTPGHRVTIQSFQENQDGSVTCTVAVTGEFNFVAFDRNVFGIDPKSLVECDLPTVDEKVGTVLKTEDEIKGYIDMMRPLILKQDLGTPPA